MKKILLISLFAVILIGMAITISTNVLAQNNGNNRENLITQLATKLGIEQARVQKAFDEIKVENQQQNQDRLSQRLDQLISQGKITAAQKTLILNKLTELKNTYNPDSFKNLTPQKRKTEMEKKWQELKTWAEENKIDPNLIPFGIGRGKGMGMHKGWFKNIAPPSTP